jgi:hypothetical protein
LSRFFHFCGTKGPYLEPGLSSEELRDYFCKYGMEFVQFHLFLKQVFFITLSTIPWWYSVVGRIEAVWVARNPAGFAFVVCELTYF